ncbi:MAG TPA: DinB family protein, partial [Fimbriimonas sp.]|nr:DinB family protein [Fimbriimonas sp.]
GFRDTDVRWRELSPKIDSLWPNLDAVVAWLNEAHQYWMDSWANVEDFELERPRFNGAMVPGWKLIATVTNHDHYHAGQIQLQRAILAPSDTPPPPEGDLWETYCKDFPCW